VVLYVPMVPGRLIDRRANQFKRIPVSNNYERHHDANFDSSSDPSKLINNSSFSRLLMQLNLLRFPDRHDRYTSQLRPEVRLCYASSTFVTAQNSTVAGRVKMLCFSMYSKEKPWRAPSRLIRTPSRSEHLNLRFLEKPTCVTFLLRR
jgi:hypothetical protein